MDLLHQFHHVFFLGDLNYRVDREWDDTLALVAREQWKKLLLFDQLRQEMLTLSVFPYFQEVGGFCAFCFFDLIR